jgi:ABC-type multidrug transport system fused ATPase/permease subunit
LLIAFRIVLLIVAGITVYFWRVTVYYLKGARELRRTESTTRSPIFSLFGETYVGITTIRAYADTARFLKQNFDLQNTNARPYYDMWLMNRWLAMQTDISGAAFMFFVALIIILTPSMTASFAGFCLTYASVRLAYDDRSG